MIFIFLTLQLTELFGATIVFYVVLYFPSANYLTIFTDTIYNIILICLIVSGYHLSTLQRWEKK